MDQSKGGTPPDEALTHQGNVISPGRGRHVPRRGTHTPRHTTHVPRTCHPYSPTKVCPRNSTNTQPISIKIGYSGAHFGALNRDQLRFSEFKIFMMRPSIDLETLEEYCGFMGNDTMFQQGEDIAHLSYYKFILIPCQWNTFTCPLTARMPQWHK
jgi:hypothetical protein